MAITARLEAIEPERGRRGAPRRALRLATVGALASGDARTVLVHNASATGLLLESTAKLAVGEAIDIDLPQAGRTPARIVWASGELYGCRFDEPISAAALAAAQLRGDAGLDLTRPIPPRTLAPESFGSRLRRLRKQQGLTLEELGRRLAVSKPTVWAWEKGKARPLVGRIAAIADVLGVGEDELTAPHGEMEAGEALARSREEIARAYGIEPGKVRIMIEL